MTFAADLAAGRASQKPTMALRRDSNGRLDDVVVNDVTMFRAEMMDDDLLWMCCYFPNGEFINFQVFARKRGCLEFTVGDLPAEWIDWDARGSA